ncbi:uncharacterized protein MAM_03724 [Metarhizium album ARSEF 1941]|uniref:Reticulocyte-binding protein 2 like protein a n=1 Tax=Metarhizium album (strain ARSEF 1941) TaxID=1081103 RepID=A0A0B2X0I3_METAS|nr:uncharacterized protein MAM_03724 [Metarhizium album ARSEF 1941]KHN98600.1 hypothetical protein MAM_03724 [Metarhizium album ARSEF 1941]
MSYYSDDEDINVRIRHQGHSPRPVRYVERPRDYYGSPAGPSYLVPEQHTTVVARSRSHDRCRDRRASPPGPVPVRAQPVIINNRFYGEHSSDDDDDYRRRRQVAHRRRRSSGSRSRSRLTREEWEAELARRELERLRLENSRDREERRVTKEARDEAELKRAKRELDEIKRREARAEEEKRIKGEMELKRLQEEEKAVEQKKRRDQEAAEAVERYKKLEADRMAAEKLRKEEEEREYRRRMQEDLLKSGLDEKAISAILGKRKIPDALQPGQRPMHTRMARRHLSIETLRTFCVEFDIDSDPEYLLIKRWVPEWEQDQFWRHTKYIREKRNSTLLIEEKKSHRQDPQFEWVRKKGDRKRSKSPGGLLMYLAGARPA